VRKDQSALLPALNPRIQILQTEGYISRLEADYFSH